MVRDINEAKAIIERHFKDLFDVIYFWRAYNHSDDLCRHRINKYANIIFNYYFLSYLPDIDNEGPSVLMRNLVAIAIRRTVVETRELEKEFAEYYNKDSKFRNHYLEILSKLTNNKDV